MKGPYITCAVPFCRRKRGLRKGDNGVLPDDFICGDHWPLVSPRLRRLLHRRRRRWERYRQLSDGKACDRLWDKCKAQAIERGAGL